MPNLDHDPQNPTDLLGRPIAEGDVVAWGTTHGRSAALCVAVIDKIRFIQTACLGNGWKNREVPQSMADDYTLRLRPLKSTGSVSTIDKRPGAPRPSGSTSTRWILDEDIADEPDRYEVKTKSVQLVKNIVKLEPIDGSS